jgi:hypothetical protein
MVVCPLCEHPQASGTECEVCGRALVDAPELTAPVQPMAELEPTQAAPQGSPAAEDVPGLEVNAHAPVHAVAAEVIPDLEPSAAPPVDVTAVPIPDIDRGLEGLPADAPTPFPAMVICRYCRTEAQLGERICARCGMRLPVLALVPTPAAEAEEPRLCTCGAPVRGGASTCPSCGARLG